MPNVTERGRGEVLPLRSTRTSDGQCSLLRQCFLPTRSLLKNTRRFGQDPAAPAQLLRRDASSCLRVENRWRPPLGRNISSRLQGVLYRHCMTHRQERRRRSVVLLTPSVCRFSFDFFDLPIFLFVVWLPWEPTQELLHSAAPPFPSFLPGREEALLSVFCFRYSPTVPQLYLLLVDTLEF